MDEIKPLSNGPGQSQPSGPAAALARAHASEGLDQATEVERERLSRELEESRRLFRHIADLIPDALTVYDMDTGRLVFVNRRNEQITGYTPDEVVKLGQRFATTLWHPDDLPSLDTHRRRLRELADDEIYENDYRLRQPDGAYRSFHSRTSVFKRGHDRQVQQIITLTQDTSERQRTQQALRQSEERFRRYFDLGLIGMAITLPNKAIAQVNDQLCSILGYERDELLQMTWAEFTHPEDLGGDIVLFDQVLAGELDGYTLDKRYVRKDGQPVDVTISVKCLRRPDGAVDCLVALAQDVTQRKQAEAALRRAKEVLETRVLERTRELAEANQARQQLLQQLVSAEEDERRHVSRELHDSLGQYLTALNLGLKSLQAQKDCPLPVTVRLQHLHGLTLRLEEAVDRLATELRPPALDDLGLDAALEMLAREWSGASGIQLDMHMHGLEHRRLPAAIETTLYRIVQEALTNILKHANAGRVSLIVGRSDQEVLAIVEDDGCGFDLDGVRQAPDVQRKLGLRGMQERAALAGGSLDVETTPGAGTTLYIHVPLRVNEAGLGAVGHAR